MAEQVALLQDINETAHEAFRTAGYEVVAFPKSIEPDELAQLAAESVVLGVRSGPKLPAGVLSDNLEAICVFGVGVNHVARQGEGSADERGIAVFNAAHENTRSVAELVIGSVFSLMRNMHGHNRQMHGDSDAEAGEWTKTNGREVRDKTIGILGYGSIGSQVSALAESVGMNVRYYDPMSPLRRGRAAPQPSVEAVLASSDVVTLHMPGTKDNYHIINADTLAMMKPGSYLINAARGDLVDYGALKDALDSGHLAGAAIDVYTDEAAGYTEPSKKGDDFDHILRGHNALLLSHIGGSTVEAQRSIGESVAKRTLAYLTTGNTMGSVNMPNKALNGLPDGTSRLLHIHDDKPGAMAIPIGILAEHDLNIADTVQGKNDEGLGYVALDVEGEIPEIVIEAIRSHAITRRVRVVTG